MGHHAATSQLSIEKIGMLLNQGRAQEALDLINGINEHSPVWQNAKGVCLLRLGMFKAASAILRDLVFPGNCITVSKDTPALYRANFATAMLLMEHMDSAMAVLENMGTDGHTYAEQVLSAVNQWKRNLSLLERMGLAIGWYPKRPFHLECPPGGL